ncbi:MAG: hypothetical protein FWD85_06160 [Microbacteriaceae bacterium]|nr:hypothetical protein [Microbacteriaceae bacterium]MCL2794875.1 hypothetical protein [Microbacteriaceae bacterium]
MKKTTLRVRAAALAAGTLASLGTLAAVAAPADAAAPHPVHNPAALRAQTIFSGAAHGWSDPDDIAVLGGHVFVGFQNGVPSTGPAAGTPQQSTLVELSPNGRLEHSWNLTGKIDGLGADRTHDRVIVTVNEDADSSMWVVTAKGAAQHYAYDQNPLPHGGGTDAVSVFHGVIYTSASAPTTTGPAVYRVTLLPGGSAHVASTAIGTDSMATVANAGQHGSTQLALTDPDSNTVVPRHALRFGGDFMLDSQGDQQAIFASSLAPGARLKVLNLSQAIDDTAFAPARRARLVVTDAAADTVDLVTGGFTPGAAYSVVTPGDANTPPVPTPDNYLARLDLNTGALTPLAVSGVTVTPHGAAFLG